MLGGRPCGTPPRDQDAVSPVVGMLLVLAVSVVMTGATLAWGLPAIDEMKANVEVESMRAQFQELNADFQELVAGSAGKTAKPWQPSLQRGDLRVDAMTEQWVVAVDKRNTPEPGKFNFEWGCVDAGEICVRNNGTGTLPDVTVEVFLIDGVAKIRGVVTSSTFTQEDSWAQDDVHRFAFESASGTDWLVANHTLKVEIWVGGEDALASEAWFVNTGEVRYTLPTASNTREVVSTNGGLIVGTNDDFVVLRAPGIPAPRLSDESTRFFARFIEIEGHLAFSGSQRFDVLMTLHGTSRLQNHDCKSLNAEDDAGCIERVRVYALGEFAPLWQSLLTNEANGYQHTSVVENSGLPGDASAYVLYEPPLDGAGNHMTRNRFSFVHSVIELKG